MKKAISIPGAPAPIGPYSQAIFKNNTLFVSGQIPLNPMTGELVLDTVELSTQQVMENIKSLISAAGFEMND
ncbi:MAG: Rid family hydrolase, partial [Bacteroidota bacterium]